MKTVRTISTALFFLSMICLGQTPAGLHLVKKTVVGGEGGWDYLTVD